MALVTGLTFDQEIPHHSPFSKNRHGRFQESKVFEQLFEEIVARCLEAGLVQGDNLSVDGSFVEANANKGSRIPREHLAEAAQVNQTVRQYLVELEQQNPTEEPVHQQDQVSTTDSLQEERISLEGDLRFCLDGQPMTLHSDSIVGPAVMARMANHIEESPIFGRPLTKWPFGYPER